MRGAFQELWVVNWIQLVRAAPHLGGVQRWERGGLLLRQLRDLARLLDVAAHVEFESKL